MPDIDFTEALTVFVLGVIAVTALFTLDGEGKGVATAIGTGLIGYLAKTIKNGFTSS